MYVRGGERGNEGGKDRQRRNSQTNLRIPYNMMTPRFPYILCFDASHEMSKIKYQIREISNLTIFKMEITPSAARNFMSK